MLGLRLQVLPYKVKGVKKNELASFTARWINLVS